MLCSYRETFNRLASKIPSSQPFKESRRNILRWIAKAKRASTKAKRIDIVVEHCVRCEKVPNY